MTTKERYLHSGEDRVLAWVPELKGGEYIVRARLFSDLNRYYETTFLDDQTETGHASLSLEVK